MVKSILLMSPGLTMKVLNSSKKRKEKLGMLAFISINFTTLRFLGWWSIGGVIILSVLWQTSMIASDYWLAYETSEERAQFFNPFVFISIYAIIVVVSVLLIVLRSYSFMILGLKTAHIFFSQILHSILHAPMSFFDTTPSGRILSRVRIRRLIVCYSKCHMEL